MLTAEEFLATLRRRKRGKMPSEAEIRWARQIRGAVAGFARARALSPERRREIAVNASKAGVAEKKRQAAERRAHRIAEGREPVKKGKRTVVGSV